MQRLSQFLAIILPGMLVAATGVGAGDLATASFTGSQLGVAVLWAVVVGGVFKYVLTEGLARWQLVTGSSFLEGLSQQLGKTFSYLFIGYLVLWSFFVGSALISANGVALYAMLPFFENPGTGKVVFGIASSVIGLVLVRSGGFKLFEKAMALSIGLMFVIVVITAILLWPGHSQVLSGLFIPGIPDADTGGLTWTIALIGGVGGTLTIFCYGYWIKEKQRVDAQALPLCRIDLIVGYTMTVIFGLAMVIIGSTINVEGKGTSLLIQLANSLEGSLGPYGRWMFLIGAFCAVFSSLLGVWQAVPYLFADIVSHLEQSPQHIMPDHLDERKSYKIYQCLLAIIPIVSLWMSFKEVQKLYAVIGTLFMPLLALALLIFNNRVGLGNNKNGILTNSILVLTLVFFSYIAWRKLFG